MSKRIGNWMLLLVSVLASLMVGEVILRLTIQGAIDPFDFSTVFFINSPRYVVSVDNAADDFSKKYLMDRSLYQVNPEFRSYGEFRKESALIAPHVTTIMWHEMMKQWNYNYLKNCLADDSRYYDNDMFRWYKNQEVYAFEGYDSSEYPVFRYFTNSMSNRLECKSRFNSFGWGGSNIQFQKPAKTIRIAFLGASTTQQTTECDFAYPDYIEAWLDEWAKNQKMELDFEVINAARFGQTSSDLANIYKYEIKPIQPDVVVYYEGRNQFYLEGENSSNKSVSVIYNLFSSLYVRSALLQTCFIQFHINTYLLFEKCKNGEKAKLPSLNPYTSNLPLNLNKIVCDLDTIRVNIDTHHQSFVLCSYPMILDDSVLSKPSYAQIYSDWLSAFKNTPISELKRMSVFQNNIYKNYALMHQTAFCDVASELQKHPYYFFDGIHISCDAKKLQAWIVFKDLLPLIEAKIKSGKLPHYEQNLYSSHPYIKEDAFLVNLKNLSRIKPQ